MPSNHPKYIFKVVSSNTRPTWELNTIFLVEDDWDDWFAYSTMYQVLVCTEEKEKLLIGSIKVGQFNMDSDQRRSDLSREFDILGERFFSVGQGADYYEKLNNLGSDFRMFVLQSLNDIAANLDLWEKVRELDVTRRSLSRGISHYEVEGQFHRMAQGGAKLTSYNFTYRSPKRDVKGRDGIKLSFEVKPESFPPTNVHVLIGRNGVGKTHTMNLMTKALIAKRTIAAQSGDFITHVGNGSKVGAPFSNLVSVCFSAFDSFLLSPDDMDREKPISFSYVGLRRFNVQKNKVVSTKSPERLATEFVKSALECSVGSRAERWKSAVETLESDSIFAAAEALKFIEGIQDKERSAEVKKLFKRLSSGHQIVLLSITKLVETVEEKTLVLIDEPESHLHPPLLSAFIRALSDLLVNRNGVAVIATHSPVVIQEVPQRCVWKMQRSGVAAKAERPDCQTFGENVGILTREIFGFEITDAGFHRLLREVADRESSFEQAVEEFQGELGAEARAMLRAMYLRKEL